jgi:hypothetical protein
MKKIPIKEVWEKPAIKVLKFKETKKNFSPGETGTSTTAVGPS